MRSRGLSPGVCLVWLVLSAEVVPAKELAPLAGVELERLTLNPGAAGSLLVPTGELLPRGELRVSVMGHYQHNPLVLARGTEVYQIVGNRVTTHLAGAWSPMSGLELSAQVPVVALQHGDDLSHEGIARPARHGLSMPSVAARWGLLSQQNGGWADVALGMGVGVQLGNTWGLSEDAGLRYTPGVMVGRRFGWFRLALEAQALVRSRYVRSAEAGLQQPEMGSELRFGAVAATVGRRLRWELDVMGSVPLVVDQPGSVELLLGPRYLANPSTELFALAGVGVGSAPGTPLFRVMVGTAFGGVKPPRLPGESAVTCDPGMVHSAEECPDMDEDNDGVRNGFDRCPHEAGTLERNGCPRRDLDNDGIEDALDECPTEPGEAAWKGCEMPDDDKDGVENDQDSCPSEAGPPEGRGCPMKDKDGDGLEDDVDQCPEQKGEPQLNGCPELDSDRDKVINRLDSCPNEVGTEENHGCPTHKMPLVTLSRARMELSGRVFFVPAQPMLEPRSISLLNWVVRVINEHPEFPLIVVGAHTDNRGFAEANLRLSQMRAESVRQYLIKNGVAPERVEARGYGDTRPIDSNATSIGRENNRRVEFIIVWPE